MFFESAEEIPKIAQKTGFSIFSLENFPEFKEKNFLTLRPDEKTKKISIASVREFLLLTLTKKNEDVFFVIESPESMSAEASNAFLKNLEEPKEKYHFIFLTRNISQILPTILSRAQIYFERTGNILEKPLKQSEDVKTLAKELIVAKDKDLSPLAKKISDKKDRNFALEVVSTAIEISYKSFFLKNDVKFLKKIPNLLKLYENLNQNGNIKLHIIADML